MVGNNFRDIERGSCENTNLTDEEIDNDPQSASGAVLNEHNKGHTSAEQRSAAGRVLNGSGSSEDERVAQDAAKGIPKNPGAKKRDREQKGE